VNLALSNLSYHLCKGSGGSLNSGALNYVEFRAAMNLILNYVDSGLTLNLTWFRAWCMAEREGFEPSIPF
jgi:hypothetical protein